MRSSAAPLPSRAKQSYQQQFVLQDTPSTSTAALQTSREGVSSGTSQTRRSRPPSSSTRRLVQEDMTGVSLTASRTNGSFTRPKDAVSGPGEEEARADTDQPLEEEEGWYQPPCDSVFVNELLASLQTSRGNAPPVGGTALPQPALATQQSKEEKDIEELRIREKQVEVIQRRRLRSRRRWELVDDMFNNALERRMRAMQKIAMDPPAERLIGHSMLQYVPAALLPEELSSGTRNRQGTNAPVYETPVEKQLLISSSTSQETPPMVSHHRSATANSGADAIVFLTQLDHEAMSSSVPLPPLNGTSSNASSSVKGSGARPATDRSSSTRTAAPCDGASQSPLRQDDETISSYDGMTSEEELLYRLSHVTEGNREKWRELGYHVIMVGDDKKAGQQRQRQQGKSDGLSPLSSAGAPLHPESAGRCDQSRGPVRNPRSGGARNTHPSEATWEWMRLAPLPMSYLVQRRLPEEDLTMGELLELQRVRRWRRGV